MSIITLPVRETERSAAALLKMLIEQAHVNESAFPGKSVLSVVLDDWQIDLLSSYGSHAVDLEDSDDDDEDEAIIIV